MLHQVILSHLVLIQDPREDQSQLDKGDLETLALSFWWWPRESSNSLSLQDVSQMKMDWGKFLDDPDKYIDVFQELTQTFHLWDT